jgi:hypothetical protein
LEDDSQTKRTPEKKTLVSRDDWREVWKYRPAKQKSEQRLNTNGPALPHDEALRIWNG